MDSCFRRNDKKWTFYKGLFARAAAWEKAIIAPDHEQYHGNRCILSHLSSCSLDGVPHGIYCMQVSLCARDDNRRTQQLYVLSLFYEADYKPRHGRLRKWTIGSLYRTIFVLACERDDRSCSLLWPTQLRGCEIHDRHCIQECFRDFRNGNQRNLHRLCVCSDNFVFHALPSCDRERRTSLCPTWELSGVCAGRHGRLDSR